MGLAAELNERNIQPYVKELTDYFNPTTVAPFFKSLILNLLIEHFYDNQLSFKNLKES